MPNVLITGADNGSGAAYVRAFSDAGWQVFAAAPGGALPYDPRAEDAAEALARRLEGVALDAIIFAAETRDGVDLAAEAMTPQLLIDAMLVNTYAPLHLAACLQPNLARARAPAIVALVGNAGVTGLSVMARGFPLKTSKAALRQMWRNLSVEWHGWGCRCVASVSGEETGCTDAVARVLAAVAAPETPHYCEV